MNTQIDYFYSHLKLKSYFEAKRVNFYSNKDLIFGVFCKYDYF